MFSKKVKLERPLWEARHYHNQIHPLSLAIWGTFTQEVANLLKKWPPKAGFGRWTLVAQLLF